MLCNHPELLSLDLSRNSIDNDSLVILAKGLGNTKLQSLNLSDNNLQCELSGYVALSEALANNRTLQTLALNRTRLKHEGIEAILKALENHPSLQSLELAGNNLSQASINNLAHFLKKNTTLASLNLYHNSQIDDENAGMLAYALTKNKALRVLKLDLNKIGDIGGEFLAKALLTNNTLHSLSLAYTRVGNLIDDIGARSLSDSLTVNTTLQSLNLSATTISICGEQLLADALQRNYSLQELIMEDELMAHGFDPAEESGANPRQSIRHRINQYLARNKMIPSHFQVIIGWLRKTHSDEQAVRQSLKKLETDIDLEALPKNASIRRAYWKGVASLRPPTNASALGIFAPILGATAANPSSSNSSWPSHPPTSGPSPVTKF